MPCAFFFLLPNGQMQSATSHALGLHATKGGLDGLSMGAKVEEPGDRTGPTGAALTPHEEIDRSPRIGSGSTSL